MKKTAFLFILFGILHSPTFSQLVINQSMTPAQLVQNVLVGSGVTVTNVTYTGSLSAIGEFINGGTTNIGLTRGIIMASGNATTCVGPNNSGSAGTNLNMPGDPTLNSIINGTSYDAAVLEFDFSPLSDTIRFRYVFGSDEYPEYVNSTYNDVFGFFISGPNPVGPAYNNYNIARIPGSLVPVSINNVNNGTSNSGPCNNCAYYINNTGGITIQYDGFTTVLTAWAKVTPCATYHMKLAIADVGDGILDSGVFLEENSFSTNAISISSSYSVPGAKNIAIEGCNNALVKFKRPKKIADTTVINIDTIYGTATNGVDYPFIGKKVKILPNQLSTTVVIAPMVDGIIEGIEMVIMVIKSSLCTWDTLYIPIADYTPMTSITSPDTAVCQDTAHIWVHVSNGAPPFTYTWTPALTLSNPGISNPYAFPPQTTTYVVTIKDTTGCPPIYDSVKVTVNPIPNASFMYSPTTAQCEPSTIQFTDMSYPNISSWHWNFGDGGTSTSQSPSHTYSAGTYTVTLNVTTTDGCKSIISLPNLKVWGTPKANFSANPPVTTIDNPLISFTNLSQGATSYFWDFGDGTTSTDFEPQHSFDEGAWNVCLKVVSQHGCVDSTCRQVMIIVDKLEIPNIITPNGDGFNEVFHIKNIEKIKESHLIIYNRWGKKVYEADNYRNDWNGENNPDGVYFFILKYKTYFRDGEFNGTLTIMR